MENGPEFGPVIAQDMLGPFESKSTNTNQHSRLHGLDDFTQCLITSIQQITSLCHRQLVWCPVTAFQLKKGKRTMIPDEEAIKELISRTKAFFCPSPEATPTDFSTRALESQYWAFGVLIRRTVDWFINAEEILCQLDFAKWNACLDHPPGPGVHTQEKGLRSRAGITLQVTLMRTAGILQGVVHDMYRCTETHGFHVPAKRSRNGDDIVSDARSDRSHSPSPPRAKMTRLSAMVPNITVM